MEDFDMAGAVESLSSDMGFGEPESSGDDIQLEVTLPAGEGETPPEPKDELAESLAEQATPEEGAAPDDDAAPEDGAEVKPAWTPPETHKHLFNEDGTLRTWRKEAAAEFAALPEVVQAEILKREEDIHHGIAQYREAASFGNSIQEVLSPYQPLLRQYNVNPSALVADLMKAQYTFVAGTPEAKAELFTNLAQNYGVDLAALGAQQAYVDPQVQNLQNQLRVLQSQLQSNQTQQAQAQQQTFRAEIDAFAADPANVYFDEVANDMVQLIQSGLERSLKSAYEAAVYRNPTVRAKEIARIQAEKASQEAAAAAKKVAEARKATAANVRSKGKGGSAATPTGSMDDTIEETLAAIKRRS